jgi:hypothetical protein
MHCKFPGHATTIEFVVQLTLQVMFSVSKTCGSTDAGPFTIASNGKLLNVEMPSIRSNENYTVCYAPSSGSTFFPQSVTIKATGVVHKSSWS